MLLHPMLLFAGKLLLSNLCHVTDIEAKKRFGMPGSRTPCSTHRERLLLQHHRAILWVVVSC
jgi:hypothetical protein